MAQILTVEEVRANARTAFEEGRLGFQIGATACLYKYNRKKKGKPCGCAIGVSLNEESRAAILDALMDDAGVLAPSNDAKLSQIVELGILSIPDDDDLIELIQIAHDEIIFALKPLYVEDIGPVSIAYHEGKLETRIFEFLYEIDMPGDLQDLAEKTRKKIVNSIIRKVRKHEEEKRTAQAWF